MTFRLSLRKKLVYTFLGGSLLTVLLFSIVIKEIMNDYFRRLADVRLQFVSELGQREIRTNVAIFQDAFQNIFDGMATTIGALAEYIGPHKILWATDYPHRDGFFPGAPEMLRERMKGLSSEAQRKVMAGGAMGFYGLH